MLVVALAVNARTVSDSVRNVSGDNVFLPVMPQEKVYLHFDNTGYFNGETIYFKAYVVNSASDSLSRISRVLYVELLNPGGDVIITRKCAIVDGQANGEIKLEKVFGSGFYEVRAYTRYMTNWGVSACFSRVFPIFNAPKKDGDYSQMVIDKLSHKKRLPNYRRAQTAEQAATATAAVKEDVTISFYPEGGYSVKGLESTVAFTLNNFSEKSNDSIVAVRLLDANGQTLDDDVVVYADGRGTFTYVPDNTQVTLCVTTAGGKDRIFPVPEAAEEGVSLNVNAVSGKNILVSVAGSQGLKGKKFGLLMQHTGTIIATDTFTLGETPNTFAFQREQMPDGVSVLTIFDGGGAVLADRMVFVIPQAVSSDSIKVEAKTESLRPCGKVELELTTLPNTTFSFSAMDAATMPNGKEGNAKTWLLLSSELRGYIANPEYYLEADDAEHRRAADLLMLVQGWRKYTAPKLRRIQPIEDKQYLFGQLRQAKKKHGVANVDLSVYLYNRQGQSLRGDTRTDSVGNYRFELPDCNGDWNMLMYTKKDDKNVKYYVGIDRHFSPSPRTLAPEEQEVLPVRMPNLFVLPEVEEDDDMEYVPLSKRNKVLPTVKVKARRIFEKARESWESEKTGEYQAQLYYNCDVEADKIADSGAEIPGFYGWLQRRNPLFGGNDVEMENSVQTAFEETSVEEVEEDNSEILTAGEITDEEEMFDGLTYKNRPIVWILNNNYYMTTGVNNRKFIITYMQGRSLADVMPVFLDEVKSVYVRDDLSKLEHYVMSSQLAAMNPVMVFVYTHHSFLRNVKGLRRTHFQGYDEPEMFKMEDYSILPPMEDFRRTIFWEPNVKTDKNGKAKVNFYNNSSCTQMYISAEGITSDGRYIINN